MLEVFPAKDEKPDTGIPEVLRESFNVDLIWD